MYGHNSINTNYDNDNLLENFDLLEANEEALEQELDEMQKKIDIQNTVLTEKEKKEVLINGNIKKDDNLGPPKNLRRMTTVPPQFRLDDAGRFLPSNQNYDLYDKLNQDLLEDEKINQGVKYIDFRNDDPMHTLLGVANIGKVEKKEEALEDDAPLTPPVFRRTGRAFEYRLTFEGDIEDSNKRYNLDHYSNQDLVKEEEKNHGKKYINFSDDSLNLISILGFKNITEKTGISNPAELERLSLACGQVFFQLMRKSLLKNSEDYSKILDLFLQYDAYVLEKIAGDLATQDLLNRNLDDVLSVTFKAVSEVFADKIHENDKLTLNDLMTIVLEYSIPMPATMHRNRLFTIKIDKQQEGVAFKPPSPKS